MVWRSGDLCKMTPLWHNSALSVPRLRTLRLLQPSQLLGLHPTSRRLVHDIFADFLRLFFFLPARLYIFWATTRVSSCFPLIERPLPLTRALFLNRAGRCSFLVPQLGFPGFSLSGRPSLSLSSDQDISRYPFRDTPSRWKPLIRPNA
jgi:hypothetical protein